MPKTKGDAGEE